MRNKRAKDIIAASEDGDVETVRRLIEKDSNVLIVTTDLRMSPLHRAARFGHVEVVRLLLQAGMKPTIRDARRMTPLHNAACDEESLYCLKILIDAGCPIESKDAYGDTPLMVACTYSNLPTVAYLLNCGASVTATNRRGWNARQHAEFQLTGVWPRKGSDWKGQIRALNNIIYFLDDAMDEERRRQSLPEGPGRHSPVR